MRCPYCGAEDTSVKDSRPVDEQLAIRRRRICSSCGGRFTTFERLEARIITVVKKDNKRQAFDRHKLSRSVYTALRKRPFSPEKVEKMISKIVQQVESNTENEITSQTIGALIMASLKEFDRIAYIRFASVYCDFKEPNDFKNFIGGLDDSKHDTRNLKSGDGS